MPVYAEGGISMSDNVYLSIVLGSIAAMITIIIVYAICRSPFQYPYLRITIDISGKRNPSFEDLLDDYIINNGIIIFQDHCFKVEEWKQSCEEKISSSIFKKMRKKQYESCLDDAHMFLFQLSRKQTRYKQINYVRQSYKVDVTDKTIGTNIRYIERRFQKLKQIEFACPISQYNSKQQRKFMTPELRHKIAVRDNYTCQICGKYMPDGVGLQIDHIIPISKGGKTIPSNLQVLCSKCNGKKSDK